MSDNHLSSQLLYWISRLDLDCVSCERTLWIAGLLVHFLVLGIFLSLFGLWKPLHVRWPQTSARATIRLALLSVCHQSKPNEDKQQSEQWLFCVNMCVCVCVLYEPASGFHLCCVVDFFILPNIFLLLSIIKWPDSLLRASLKNGRARLRDEKKTGRVQN